MTPTQATDLTKFKALPEQEQTVENLPKSFENLFLEDCLEVLKNNEEARKRFNIRSQTFLIECEWTREMGHNTLLLRCEGFPFFSFEHLRKQSKELASSFINTLLSRTRNPETGDLEAVIPFLDVFFKSKSGKELNFTLGENLLSNFCGALFTKGNSFDEALAIINFEYFKQRYL